MIQLQSFASYFSIREEDQPVEHMEDLQPRLMDGENHCAVGVSQLVQVSEKLK